MTAEAILAAPLATDAEKSYRLAEIDLRRRAKWAFLCGNQPEGARLMELAHHAGMAFVRNHIGPHADRWEEPPSPLSVAEWLRRYRGVDGNEPRDGMWR